MKRIIVLVSILMLLVPFAAVAQVDFCEGNFDYDQDVDGTDASTFKADFGRSPFKNMCPSEGPAPVQKTGQITSYATGDDGYFQRGVEKPLLKIRFTNNGNGTVTDNLTGLMWYRDANLFGARNWSQALNDIASLNIGVAYSDWRLPNVRELQTLLDYSQRNPALPSAHPFLNTPATPAFYWSATTKMGVEPSPFDEAYGVNLGDGTVGGSLKSLSAFYVWPVRGGQ